MPCSLLFSELNALNTPRSTHEPPSLITKEALAIKGRLAEGLMQNDSVTIPLRGPALEVVTLIRLYGEDRFKDLLEDKALRFIFCPGQLAYISEQNRRMGIRADPGITVVTGRDRGWQDPITAVQVALAEDKELGFSRGKARRLSQAVARQTIALDTKRIFDRVLDLAYPSAFKLLADDLEVSSQDGFLKFDNEKDNPKIRKLLDVAHAHLDIVCASYVECPHIIGNDMTWQVLEGSLVAPAQKDDLEHRLGAILELEGVPDIPRLIITGHPITRYADIRMDKDVVRFRNFIAAIPEGDEKSIITSYYRRIRQMESDANLVTPMKLLRVGVIYAISKIVGDIAGSGTLGSIIGAASSYAQALFENRLPEPWTPKVFIEKNLRYYDAQRGPLGKV